MIMGGGASARLTLDASQALASVRQLRNELRQMGALKKAGPDMKPMAGDMKQAAGGVRTLRQELRQLGANRTSIPIFKNMAADAKAAAASMKPIASGLREIARTTMQNTFRTFQTGARTAQTATQNLLRLLQQVARVTFRSTTTALTAGLTSAGAAAARLRSALASIGGRAINVNTGPANSALDATILRVRQLRSEMDQMSGDLAGVGLGQGAIAAPFLGLTTVGVSNAIELEQAIKNVDVALGGLDGAELQALTLDMQTLAINSQYSATEVSNVALELARAGVALPQLEGVTKAVLDLSQATGTDLNTSVGLLTTTMKVYSPTMVEASIAMTDASRAADILTIAANNTKADISGLEIAMRPIMATAGQLGISFEELSAAVGSFIDFGMKPGDAGLSLNRMLTDLSTPTSEAAIEMERLGISVFDAQGAFIGFPALMDQLQASFAGMSDKQRIQSSEMLVGAEAADTFALAVAAGGDPVRVLMGLMDETGIAAGQATERLNTTAGAIERMMEGFGTLAGSLMRGLLPAIKAGAEALSDFFQWANQLPPALLKTIGAVLSLVGAIIGFNAVMLLRAAAMRRFGADLLGLTGKTGLIRGFFATFASGILRVIPLLLRLAGLFGIVGLAITGLTLAYGTNFLGIADVVDGTIDKVQEFFGAIREGMGVFEDVFRPFDLASLDILIDDTAIEDAVNGVNSLRGGIDALVGDLSEKLPSGNVLDTLGGSFGTGSRLNEALTGASAATGEFASNWTSATRTINPATKVVFGLGYALERIGAKRLGRGIQRTAVAAEQLGDFLTDLWKGGPRAAMEAFERLPQSLQPVAKMIGGVVLGVKDLSQAFQRGGIREFARSLPGVLSRVGQSINQMVLDLTGLSLRDWTLDVAVPRITGWLADAGRGAFELLLEAGGWAAGKVMDLAGWVLNVGLPTIRSAAGDLWQWAKEQITGREGDQTITLGDVVVTIAGFIKGWALDVWAWAKGVLTGLSTSGGGGRGAGRGFQGIDLGNITVNMAGFVWGEIEDLWGWVKRSLFSTSTSGKGNPQTMTGAGGGGGKATVDIGDVIVNMGTFAWGVWQDLGNWVKNVAFPQVKDFAIDIGNITVNMLSFVWGKIEDLGAWLKRQFGGSGNAPASSNDVEMGMGGTAGLSIDLPNVGVNISRWVKGVWADLGPAVGAIIDAIGSINVTTKDGVFKLSIDGSDFEITIDWGTIWEELNPEFTAADVAKANEIGENIGRFLAEQVRAGIEAIFSGGGAGGGGPFFSGDLEMGLLPDVEAFGAGDILDSFLRGIFEGAGEVVADAAADMWSGLTTGLEEAMGLAKGKINESINEIIQGINKVIAGLNKINPLGDPIPFIPEIPMETGSPVVDFINRTYAKADAQLTMWREVFKNRRQEIAQELTEAQNLTGPPSDSPRPGEGDEIEHEPVTPVVPGGWPGGVPPKVFGPKAEMPGPEPMAMRQRFAQLQQILTQQGPQAWQRLFTQNLPIIQQVTQRSLGQQTFALPITTSVRSISTGFQAALPAIATSATTNFGAARMAGVGQTTMMQTGVLGATGGMASGSLLHFGAMNTGATSNAVAMNTGVTGEAGAMQGSTTGIFGAIAGNAIIQALLMATGWTSGATQSQAGVQGGLAPVPGIVSSIGAGAAKNAYASGYNISTSLARGIRAGIPEIQAAASAAAAAANAAASAGFQEGSPSRVWTQFGENADLGLIIGLNNRKSEVAAAAEGVAEAANQAFDRTISFTSKGKPKWFDPRAGGGRGGGATPETPGGGTTPPTPDVDTEVTDWAKTALKGLTVVTSDALTKSGLGTNTTAGSLWNEADWLARVKRLGETRARDISDLFVGRTFVNDTDAMLLDKYLEHYGSPVQPDDAIKNLPPEVGGPGTPPPGGGGVTVEVGTVYAGPKGWLNRDTRSSDPRNRDPRSYQERAAMSHLATGGGGDITYINPTLTPDAYVDMQRKLDRVNPMHQTLSNGRARQLQIRGSANRVQRGV